MTGVTRLTGPIEATVTWWARPDPARGSLRASTGCHKMSTTKDRENGLSDLVWTLEPKRADAESGLEVHDKTNPDAWIWTDSAVTIGWR